MKIIGLILGFLLLFGCSSAPKSDTDGGSDALNDVLISFTYNAQASRWSEALELITYEEQLQLLDANGNVKPDFQMAMKRIKLSVLQKAPMELDSKGRLVGMVTVLLENNRRYVISDEQRSMTLEQVEKNRNFAPNTAPVENNSPAEVENQSPDITEPAIDTPQDIPTEDPAAEDDLEDVE